MEESYLFVKYTPASGAQFNMRSVIEMLPSNWRYTGWKYLGSEITHPLLEGGHPTWYACEGEFVGPRNTIDEMRNILNKAFDTLYTEGKVTHYEVANLSCVSFE